MAAINQTGRANPMGTALEAFRAALVTFAEEAAGLDEAFARNAFERARKAAEDVLSDHDAESSGARSCSYDTLVRGALNHQVSTILDETQAVISARSTLMPQG